MAASAAAEADWSVLGGEAEASAEQEAEARGQEAVARATAAGSLGP